MSKFGYQNINRKEKYIDTKKFSVSNNRTSSMMPACYALKQQIVKYDMCHSESRNPRMLTKTLHVTNKPEKIKIETYFFEEQLFAARHLIMLFPVTL